MQLGQKIVKLGKWQTNGPIIFIMLPNYCEQHCKYALYKNTMWRWGMCHFKYIWTSKSVTILLQYFAPETT